MPHTVASKPAVQPIDRVRKAQRLIDEARPSMHKAKALATVLATIDEDFGVDPTDLGYVGEILEGLLKDAFKEIDAAQDQLSWTLQPDDAPEDEKFVLD